jgi:hypothetical protein
MEDNKLYLMSVGAQQKEIEKYCFDCGAIIVGAIIFEGGEFGCCRKSDCQHEDKRLELGDYELSDDKIENIVVRKLK